MVLYMCTRTILKDHGYQLCPVKKKQGDGMFSQKSKKHIEMLIVDNVTQWNHKWQCLDHNGYQFENMQSQNLKSMHL